MSTKKTSKKRAVKRHSNERFLDDALVIVKTDTIEDPPRAGSDGTRWSDGVSPFLWSAAPMLWIESRNRRIFALLYFSARKKCIDRMASTAYVDTAWAEWLRTLASAKDL